MKSSLKLFHTFLISFTIMHFSRAQSCAECRYVSPLFDSVTIETVQFGRGIRANGDTQQLYMDVYQPHGDTVSKRPAAVFAFGGAFITGSRDDWYVKLVCNHLAKTGYVVAAIDYRIYDNITQMVTEIFGAFPTQQMRIFFRPMQDMRGAVQYLKADYSELGNHYRIDTGKIFIGGASSGAITSLMTAYCDRDSEMAQMAGGSLNPLNALGGFNSTSGFYPNYSWKAIATFNVSGALINANWIEPGDIPVICAHGDLDQVVPYKKGGFAGLTLGTFDMEGSYLVDSLARAKGVCSYLYTMEGRDHPSEDMGIEYFYSVVYRMALRMKAVIDDRSFCCPLSLDIQPGDTLFYTPSAPPVTLNAQLINDTGTIHMQWCGIPPCSVSSSSSSITFQTDTGLHYIAAWANDLNCQASDLYMLFNRDSFPSHVPALTRQIPISVYPQPASNHIMIIADLKKYKDQIIGMTIFDAKGQKIIDGNYREANGKLEINIDISSLPAATYWVTLSYEGKLLSVKSVVISH